MGRRDGTPWQADFRPAEHIVAGRARNAGLGKGGGKGGAPESSVAEREGVLARAASSRIRRPQAGPSRPGTSSAMPAGDSPGMAGGTGGMRRARALRASHARDASAASSSALACLPALATQPR